MLRTASAKPRPTAPDCARGTSEDPAGVRAGESCSADDEWGSDDGAVTSAGTSMTVASSVKRRIPKTRAKIEASTRNPSDRRRLRSGTAVSTTGAVDLTARGVTRAELFESLRRPLQDTDDLGIAVTPSPGADDVPGCEDRHPRELHESSLAPSLRRLSEEIPALPAVRPARPTAAIKLAFNAFPGPKPRRSTWFLGGASNESSTVSRSR